MYAVVRPVGSLWRVEIFFARRLCKQGYCENATAVAQATTCCSCCCCHRRDAEGRSDE